MRSTVTGSTLDARHTAIAVAGVVVGAASFRVLMSVRRSYCNDVRLTDVDQAFSEPSSAVCTRVALREEVWCFRITIVAARHHQPGNLPSLF